MIAYVKYVYKEKCIGGLERERKDKPKSKERKTVAILFL